LDSDFVEEYNELKEYFTSLPEWDESQPDFIGMYSDYFKCNNVAIQPFFKAMLKKHLVRAMRCAFGSIENRYIFILGGEQDSGKSTYIRYLQPIDEYFIESDPTLMQQKDRMIALSTHFIWNIEEIDAYNAKNLAIVKEMISKQNERLRRPFGEREKRYIRIGNFFGTTNKDNFLSDETGNTRFLIFDGKIVSFDYSNKKTGKQVIPIDRLWAQAYALWKQGFECDLTKEEKAYQENINNEYEVRNNLEELILKHFAPAKPMNHEGKQNILYFWSNSDIEIFLQEVAPRMEGIQKTLSITSAFKRLNKQFEKTNKRFAEGMEYRFVLGRENNARGKYLQPISPIAQARMDEIIKQMHGLNYPSISQQLDNEEDKPF
jgi:predicted P-loop ATPase